MKLEEDHRTTNRENKDLQAQFEAMEEESENLDIKLSLNIERVEWSFDTVWFRSFECYRSSNIWIQTIINFYWKVNGILNQLTWSFVAMLSWSLV